MKIVIHGNYLEFREDRDELITVGVQKEFTLSALSFPYVFQWMLGILTILAINITILLLMLLIDIEAFPLFFINIFIIPAMLTVIYEWSSSTWKKKNVSLIENVELQWEKYSQENIAKADKYRKEHPLEEICRKTFENCPINPIAMADLIRKITGE